MANMTWISSLPLSPPDISLGTSWGPSTRTLSGTILVRAGQGVGGNERNRDGKGQAGMCWGNSGPYGCSGARWRCPKNLGTRDGVKKPPAGLSFVCSVNVQVPVMNLFHLLWILIKGHGL